MSPQESEAFDSLPSKARDFLNYCPVNTVDILNFATACKSVGTDFAILAAKMKVRETQTKDIKKLYGENYPFKGNNYAY